MINVRQIRSGRNFDGATTHSYNSSNRFESTQQDSIVHGKFIFVWLLLRGHQSLRFGERDWPTNGAGVIAITALRLYGHIHSPSEANSGDAPMVDSIQTTNRTRRSASMAAATVDRTGRAAEAPDRRQRPGRRQCHDKERPLSVAAMRGMVVTPAVTTASAAAAVAATTDPAVARRRTRIGAWPVVDVDTEETETLVWFSRRKRDKREWTTTTMGKTTRTTTTTRKTTRTKVRKGRRAADDRTAVSDRLRWCANVRSAFVAGRLAGRPLPPAQKCVDAHPPTEATKPGCKG